MSGCLSLCPYKMNNITNNIVHELHSPHPNPNPNPNPSSSPSPRPSPSPIKSSNLKTHSIRRTMSADMSNQKWVQENGFPLKRVQSSEQLQALGEEDCVLEKKTGDAADGGSGGAAFEDIWSSILSQKKLDGSGTGPGQVPAPYIHPLVKRSTSSLSEKSLEICTESLGSETGSDGLFSYPGSEDGHEKVEGEVQVEELEEEQVDEMRANVEVGRYKYPVNKKNIGPPKSFPPPLPSLAHRDDGSNLHMRTHREDGRLVLEAVAVPSQKCFRAQRHNGRLLLTLVNKNDEQDDDDEEMMDDQVVENVGGNVEKVEIMMEEKRRKMMNEHKSCSEMIKRKLMEVTSSRSKSTWPRKKNTAIIIKSLEEEEVRQKKGSRALPPRPRVSTATATATATAADALNAYEYYWRRSESPTAALAVLKPLADPGVLSRNNTFLLADHNGKVGEEVVLVKAAPVPVGGAAGDKPQYLVPMFRGCKQPIKSLFFWEPYCIASS